MRRGQSGPAAGLEGAVRAGARLRERRLGLGLTPEDVGESLRVAARQIVAVEEGRYSELPPQPYARGLVGAYASLVGLAPEEVLRGCGPALSGEAETRRKSVFRYPERERFNWREWTVPIGLATGVVLLVAARTALEPAPVELSAPATAPAWLQRPVPEAVVTTGESPPAEDPAQPQAEVPGVRVILRSEGSTWAEAAPDGAEPRRYDLGPGQGLELTARDRLGLSLGDAGAVRVNVNGRELGYVGFRGQTKAGLAFTAAKPAAAPAPAAADVD